MTKWSVTESVARKQLPERTNRGWTKQEKADLIAVWPDRTWTLVALAQAFRRGPGAISNMAARLDLPSRKVQATPRVYLQPAPDGLRETARLKHARELVARGMARDVVVQHCKLMAIEAAAL